MSEFKNVTPEELALTYERFVDASGNLKNISTFIFLNMISFTDNIAREFGDESVQADIAVEIMNNLVVLWGLIHGEVSDDVREINVKNMHELADKAIAATKSLRDMVYRTEIPDAYEQ